MAEAPTTVTVDDASSQSVVGQTVVFTASIASPAPGMTGTVQFADDGDPIGSGTVSGGQATFETSSLALGTHAVTAVYEGDDNFIGGSSTNTVTQTVGPAATSTEVTSAHDPGLVGQTITLHRDGRRGDAGIRHADGHGVVQRRWQIPFRVARVSRSPRHRPSSSRAAGLRHDRQPGHHGRVQR